MRRSSKVRRSAVTPGVALPPSPFRYALIATLGVGVGLAVLGAISSLATVLIYVGLALFISVALEPVMAWAATRRIPRWATVTALASVVLLLTAGTATAVIPSLAEQITILASAITDFLPTIPDQPWFQWINEVSGGAVNLHGLLDGAVSFASNPNQILAVAGGVLQIGTGIVDAVTGVIVVGILTLYFSLTLPRIKAKVYALVARSKRARVVATTEQILHAVGRYVGGQMTLALINAAFTFLLMVVLGTPAPFLLGVIAFIGALIPMVGPIIGATIAVLATLSVNPLGALVAAGVLLVYMQIEAYVLTPRVMVRAVAVPGALVIISAIAGAALGGILGALVAVPIAAAALVIIDQIVVPNQDRS
jgi:predicted PurR-regulated permease PerM